jgi:hypothetical protein
LDKTPDEIQRAANHMRAVGYSEAAIGRFVTRAMAKAGDDVFPIHPDNITAVRLVLAMGTQWETASLSTLGAARLIRTGLRYGVLDQVADWEGLGKISTDDFRRVRIFEAEALTAWAEAAR